MSTGSAPRSSSDFAPDTQRSPAAESAAPDAIRGENLDVEADSVEEPCADSCEACALDTHIYRASTWQVSGVKLRLTQDSAPIIGISSSEDGYLHAEEARALARALTEAANALEALACGA